jgi:hypothetical protein
MVAVAMKSCVSWPVVSIPPSWTTASAPRHHPGRAQRPARRTGHQPAPHVADIFGKLGLAPSGTDHRRVLAVLRYLES